MSPKDGVLYKIKGYLFSSSSPVDTVAEPDELAHHEKVLAGIDKESKGQCLWLPKPPPEEMPSA